MAKLDEAMKILSWLEHNNDNTRVLHKNKGELGLTFFGIYQSAHPTLSIWNTINQVLKSQPDTKKAGPILMKDSELLKQVNIFYKREFWDKMKLDEINSQHIANEIFIFGANVNWKIAIKEAQKLIGVAADGIIGTQTLKALNNYDEHVFDKKFDDVEIAYYEQIVKNKPHLAHNLKGWINRALYVVNEIFQDVRIA
ncbi:peptidoglycan domain protein [Aliarcobacter butzleri]|uniref:putative peptidoglycan-binding domain-containing protein n=1 Tax=Aliarcobacter butzleri TaxID=28197 RepID=UPI001EDA59A5|nr:putative peptidoglycan-binding domain-containing protein [Aliarcobacter butzleri]MCG3665464.1 peptidoglycan domain protein [Aliarcobacter butzleri]